MFDRAFSDIDYAKIYVVSKEDFRDILHENIMRLSDEQVKSKCLFNTSYRLHWMTKVIPFYLLVCLLSLTTQTCPKIAVITKQIRVRLRKVFATLSRLTHSSGASV